MPNQLFGSPDSPEYRKKVYVSGYWKIAGWKKKQTTFYEKILDQTMAMLEGCHVIFYYNCDSFNKTVEDLAAKYSVMIDLQLKDLEELPCWPISYDYVVACQRMNLSLCETSYWADNYKLVGEKGVKHYQRDLADSGFNAYRSALAVWLSKIPIANLVAQEYETINTAWVDASIARFSQVRENHCFTRTNDKQSRLSHYHSGMKYYSSTIPVSASYLSGDAIAWSLVNALYFNFLSKLKDSSYGHDEETVLAHCHHHSPLLFNLLNPNQAKFNRARKLLSP
jgi:hypothetical protein